MLRCVAITKHSGRQCPYAKERHSNYCRYHHGAKRTRAIEKPNLWNLPMFYRQFVHGTVGEFVDAALAEAPSKQISLLEELSLMRASAVESIAAFSAAVENYRRNPLDVKAAELLGLTSEQMRESLHEVRIMVQACAQLDAKASDKFSVHNLQYIIAEITQVAHTAFGDNLEGAEEFTRLLKSKVKLIEQNGGTDIRPWDIDDEVRAMDASVPYTEEPLPESNPVVNPVE